ncbi:NUDIX hydrolase [Streptomyces sp. CB03911]|uniref:NUDIX hydrolase n=1 Tax=Streptomyces sp. CB03911 TaxID=1804758 RepID=UPI000965DEB7|nr:NUDIX hydrolase [Streptomyces sp. CB03911]OKI19273.1 hypothetical protein A6A07_07165 [Streptomyces sp. CB03911]
MSEPGLHIPWHKFRAGAAPLDIGYGIAIWAEQADMLGTFRVSVTPRGRVLRDVATERAAQDAIFGQQDLPDGTGAGMDSFRRGVADRYRQACDIAFAEGRGTFRDVFLEEVFEAMAEDDPVKLRAELLQAVAVGVKWIEAIDRRSAADG